ncbi:hypothetical protein SAMN05444166_2245 [Singulisphaera sp. GP187]|uniref:DUF6916 family protein n=1 Tax=Singulisphaera sp. GP187 TaxID=1882752 RepID=UPI000927EF9F|nr:hypothetical protein [Singulisphaera sp. GP187]SIO05986.1 hypothetical protein SAMN05444166_2245 [Singulisphaera sp. GP187]
MSDRLSISDFMGHVDPLFRVIRETGETVELRLIEAKPLRLHNAPPAAGEREPFSLIFRGPFQVGLPQQIHSLKHEAFGELTLFLVPLGAEGDPEGTHYQAVFN